MARVSAASSDSVRTVREAVPSPLSTASVTEPSESWSSRVPSSAPEASVSTSSAVPVRGRPLTVRVPSSSAG